MLSILRESGSDMVKCPHGVWFQGLSRNPLNLHIVVGPAKLKLNCSLFQQHLNEPIKKLNQILRPQQRKTYIFPRYKEKCFGFQLTSFCRSEGLSLTGDRIYRKELMTESFTRTTLSFCNLCIDVRSISWKNNHTWDFVGWYSKDSASQNIFNCVGQEALLGKRRQERKKA